MPKLTDLLVSAILKKGVIAELRNFKTETELPREEGPSIKLVISADHVTVRALTE